MNKLLIQHFFDPATSTLTYVVHDTKTGVVIDPVLDYDSKSGRTSFKSAETVAKYISEKNLAIPYVIDTTPTRTTGRRCLLYCTSLSPVA